MDFSEDLDKTIEEILKTHKDDILDAEKESIHLCSLCGGDLKFYHQANYLKNQITEESKCKVCGIDHGKETHVLQ